MQKWKSNLIVSWIAQLFSILGFSFALPFAPFFLQDLGVTEPAQLRLWSGFFSSAAGLSMALVTPFWGYLADKLGKKPMTLRASLGGTIALLGMGLATSPQMLLVFRVLQGLFTGTVTAYLTLVVSETPKERMGVAIGVMNSSVFLGNSVAPLMGGVFADWFGFRASFFVASGLLFASFLMSLFFVKEDFVPDKTRSFSFFSDIRTLLISGGILPLVGMMFLYGICRTMQQPVLPLFVQDIATDQSNLATQAGFVTSAAGMASILAGVIIGTLADRGKTLRIGVVCSALAGFVGIFVAMATQVWHLSLLFFISAFFIGGIDPILKIILAHIIPPEKRGSAFGILGSFRSFGWFTGSLSGGIIAAAFGLRSVFVIIAVLFGLVAVLLSLMGRGKDY